MVVSPTEIHPILGDYAFVCNLVQPKSTAMNSGLIHAHSGLRWVVLILLLVAIFNAFAKKSSGNFTEGDRKLALFTMIGTHIQFTLGIVLYFMSDYVSFAAGAMKNTVQRFYTVEHILLMIIAVALITVGHIKSKKAQDAAQKFKAISVFYLIALIVILAAIPWPFRIEVAKWF